MDDSVKVRAPQCQSSLRNQVGRSALLINCFATQDFAKFQKAGASFMLKQVFLAYPSCHRSCHVASDCQASEDFLAMPLITDCRLQCEIRTCHRFVLLRPTILEKFPHIRAVSQAARVSALRKILCGQRQDVAGLRCLPPYFPVPLALLFLSLSPPSPSPSPSLSLSLSPSLSFPLSVSVRAKNESQGSDSWRLWRLCLRLRPCGRDVRHSMGDVGGEGQSGGLCVLFRRSWL